MPEENKKQVACVTPGTQMYPWDNSRLAESVAMSLAEVVAEFKRSLCLWQSGKVSGNHQNIHSRKQSKSCMGWDQCRLDYTRTELQPSQQGNAAPHCFSKDHKKRVTSYSSVLMAFIIE